MSAHPTVGELTDRDALTAARRHEVLAHVETCAACREQLTAEDPTALFGLLALEPMPEFDLARLQRAVAAQVERTPQEAPHGWRRVAALAASVLLAATLVGTSFLREEVTPELAEAVEPAPAAVADPAGPLPRILFPTPERGIELLSSPGEAQVVDLTAGDIQVVMIFDKELDI